MIGKLKPGDLKPLHAIMFDRPGKVRDGVKGQLRGMVIGQGSGQLQPSRQGENFGL